VQFTILITFYGALSIDTGVMMDFGLQDLGMGLFLVMTNITIFCLCIYLGYVRFERDRNKIKMRRGKVMKYLFVGHDVMFCCPICVGANSYC
jgi:hypothetical protein